MAVTQNTYTGDGTTVLFSFTFPYLETTDIKVSVNGTNTTAYTLANATTIQFNTAPVNGAAIRIYRQTDDSALAAAFYPGSAIRSADLNDNFTQNLYVTQESNNNATTAITTANTALTNSTTAISTANSALSQSSTALSNSSTALSQSNTAISDSATALSQSNTAISDSAAAVSTANTASSNASAAVSTANTASTNASAAVSTANTASSNASAAVSTANTASSNATTAVNTANNALSAANAAQSTANTADANANAALNAIAGTVQYVLVANVAAIPSTPGNGDAIEIADSTGIESFTPITNLPAGFVGDSGLSVRLQYLSAGSSWNWLNYFANNSETRYLKFGGGTITGNLEIGNSGSLTFEGSTANAFETTLAVTDPTADRTITLPDVSGTVVTTGDTGSVTSTMIADGTIATGDLADGAVTSAKIADGTIVNDDINASAAIAGTKISPDFGSQNVTTTGTSTAASFIPSSSTVPTNGVYLPAANSVAISTNSVGRVFVDASGNVGLGTNSPQQGLHVHNSGSTSSRIRITNSTTTDAAGKGLQFTQSGVTSFITNNEAGDLAFATSATERMRLDSSGRLGIGTSAPSYALSVKGGSATSQNLLLTWDTDQTNAYARIRSQFAEGNTSCASEIRFHQRQAQQDGGYQTFWTTNSGGTLVEAMRIDSSQRVGIGTTSPDANLDVVRGSSGTVATFGIEGLTTNPRLRIDVDESNNTVSFNPNYSGATSPSIVFKTAEIERCRLDSSGRLLVGTSSARENFYNTSGVNVQLQVEGAGNSTRSAIVTNSNDTSGSQILLAKSRSSSVGGNSIVSSGDALGLISFQGADGTEFVEAARIFAEVDGTPGANDMPGRLVFSVTQDGSASPTERVRIDNQGNGRLFNSDGNVGFSVHSAKGANTSDSLYSGYHSATTITSGTASIVIRTNGNILNTNNSYGSLSDIKLKENIVDASSQWDDLKALQVRNYNFKEETGQQTHTQIGLIAQEVEQVSPGLVTESPDRDAEGNDLGTVTKSVNYSVLYMKAVKALQEAMERIEILEAKVAALESA